MNTKLITLLLGMALMQKAIAHETKYEIINTSNELNQWCEAEARAHFTALGQSTYQWTASPIERGQSLVVNGKLRADGQDHAIECSVAKGARTESARFRLSAAKQ